MSQALAGVAQSPANGREDRAEHERPRRLKYPPFKARPLLRLWKTFGFRISLLKSQWDELAPVLDCLSALNLRKPRIDKAAAQEIFDRHLRRYGEPSRAVRWLPHLTSARAHDAALSRWGRAGFPAHDAPAAFRGAWRAKNLEGKTDSKKGLVAVIGAHSTLDGLAATAIIESTATLLELFAAGVFYYWIKPHEILCVPRPSLWLVQGELHRADGPAVEWPTGERFFFWHGIQVPRRIIENPELITAESIRAEPNAAYRRCMMERFGMQRLPIMDRWAEWRKCHESAEFVPFVASGIHHTFRAVLERVTAYAEAAADRLTPIQLQTPNIDKLAVADAMSRFLREWGETERPLRWFEDGRSPRAYIKEKGLRFDVGWSSAYWPRQRLATVLDRVWYGGHVDPRAQIAALTPDVFHPQLVWYGRHVDPRAQNHIPMVDEADWPDRPAGPFHVLPALDRRCPDAVMKRYERLENWVVALSCSTCDDPRECRYEGPPEGRRDVSAIDIQSLSPSAPPVGLWTPLIDAFAAGLFYYSITPEEVIGIPRPSLWMAHGQLHRSEGPAVAWPTGEHHHFWRGVEVPDWVIEEPAKITAELIDAEANLERRRCLIERFGEERYLHLRGGTIIHEDRYGKLWRLPSLWPEPRVLVEVENGTTEPDGTRRKYFLRVPPSMQSAHEAVAWTYGLQPDQYAVTART